MSLITQQVQSMISAISSRGNMIFVDSVFGNDTTGVIEQEGLPFQTVEGAYAVSVAGDVIVVRPGAYSIVNTINVLSNNIFLYDGAELTNNVPAFGYMFSDAGNAVNFNLKGGKLISPLNGGGLFNGLNVATTFDIDTEVDMADGTTSIIFTIGDRSVMRVRGLYGGGTFPFFYFGGTNYLDGEITLITTAFGTFGGIGSSNSQVHANLIVDDKDTILNGTYITPGLGMTCNLTCNGKVFASGGGPNARLYLNLIQPTSVAGATLDVTPTASNEYIIDGQYSLVYVFSSGGTVIFRGNNYMNVTCPITTSSATAKIIFKGRSRGALATNLFTYLSAVGSLIWDGGNFVNTGAGSTLGGSGANSVLIYSTSTSNKAVVAITPTIGTLVVSPAII